MTIALSNFIAVTILLSGAPSQTTAFNTLLVLGTQAGIKAGQAFTGTKTYTSLTGVAEDFETSAQEYKAAAAAFKQSPAPKSIKIGKAVTVAGIGTLTLNADLIIGNTISAVVNGTIVTTAFVTSHALTMAAFAAAIDLVAGVASVGLDGANRVVTITGDAGVDFTLTGPTVAGGATQAGVVAAVGTPSITLAAALNTLVTTQDSAWYWLGLTTDLRTTANVKSAASWIEAQQRYLVVQQGDTNILDASVTSDLAYVFKGLAYARTAVWYHLTANAAEYPDIALMALRSTLQYPGSAGFAYVTLVGVTADTLTETQFADAKGKKANVYIESAGKSFTFPGMAASGLYTDLRVGADWIQSQLQAAVFDLQTRLANSNQKLPYTDDGAAQVEAVMKPVLDTAVSKGILANDGSVVLTVPKVADQAAADKSNRSFPGITFSGNLSGAIDTVAIVGNLVA